MHNFLCNVKIYTDDKYTQTILIIIMMISIIIIITIIIIIIIIITIFTGDLATSFGIFAALFLVILLPLVISLTSHAISGARYFNEKELTPFCEAV